MEDNGFNMDEKLLELYEMFDGIKEVDEVVYQLDKPIPYGDLLFYPVQVQFFTFFHVFIECLILPKHKVGNIKVIQMKYLDYLFYKDYSLKIDNTLYSIYFKELLLLCLRKNRKFKTPNGKEVETIEFIKIDEKYNIRIENSIYDNKDFENIRRIICMQNDIDLPDITLHPDIEKKYEQYKEYLRKINKDKLGNFEDMLLCLIAKTSYKKEDLCKLTIRTFNKLLERIDFIMDYELKTIISPDLEEKSRKGIKHWMSEIKKKDILEQISTDLGEIEGKIKGAN